MGQRSTSSELPEPALPDAAPGIRLTAHASETPTDCETRQPVTTIGSRRDCTLFVQASEVSKLHCALVNTGHEVIAVDLCSRSGTFVNDERITTPRVLDAADTLRVGPVSIEFELLAADETAITPESASGPPPLHLRSSDACLETATLPAVIGRRAACDIVLDTPDVSLAHALLLLLDGRLAIADLGSRSGTVVNDRRINLAWLRHGDTLSIGGESLVVEWTGPQFEPVAATAPNEPASDPITDEVATPGGGFDDLGAMLDGLKARIAASQEKLRLRTAELDEREALFEQRVAEFEARAAAFADEKKRLEQEAAEMKHALAGIARREREIETRTAALDTERQELAEQQDHCTRLKEEYEEQISRLMEREAALHEQQAALDEDRAALERRLTEVARREQDVAQAAAKIEQFRAALKQARDAFHLDELDDTNDAVAATTPAGKAAPTANNPETPPPNQVSSDDTAAALPAPLVDEPLFAGTQPSNETDLPPEVRERLRTLRRTTGRTEAQLLPQVMAEYEARRSRPPESKSSGKGRKKRRRWLS